MDKRHRRVLCSHKTILFRGDARLANLDIYKHLPAPCEGRLTSHTWVKCSGRVPVLRLRLNILNMVCLAGLLEIELSTLLTVTKRGGQEGFIGITTRVGKHCLCNDFFHNIRFRVPCPFELPI